MTTYDVIVVTEQELTQADVAALVAQHDTTNESTRYHLMVADAAHAPADDTLAVIGLRSADSYGSPAVARRTGAENSLGTGRADLATVIEHSARRLRGDEERDVSVVLIHANLGPTLKDLIGRTRAREVVIFAAADGSIPLLPPADRAERALRLGDAALRVIPHDG